MSGFPASMKLLIEEFAKMPGIGPKSAQRLAFHVLRSPKNGAEALSKAIVKVKESVRFCKICNNLSDEEMCDICNSKVRDRSVLCVVEEPNDVAAIERAREYNGVYHVLLGSLSPLDGIGPSDLKIKELLERAKTDKFKEIIIATDFNTEGEATALYLMKQLRPSGARLTRVAYGIPVGGDIEYADQATILRAFEGRREMK
ncbi:MAG: recombination mediator RecR [Candidatus Omnitrophota bacterium]|nr:recombination mediator RecR [Candidatus Omnitrophota bacterium]